jgi:gliding motility-associated-like protein
MLARKTLILFISIFLTTTFIYGQSAYVNRNDQIFQLTGGPGSCTRVPITNQCGPDNDIFSIALYRDTLYYNSLHSVQLKRFKLGVPGSCQLLPQAATGTSLTVDKNGILYSANGNKLTRYDPHTNQLTDLGVLPADSRGDMFFYKDKLLLAAFGMLPNTGGIYEVNIDNPAASTLYMQTQPFIGLLSYAEPCGFSRYFGLNTDPTTGTTQLIELNLAAKTELGLTCVLPALVVDDAASFTETGLDDKVYMTDLKITQACLASTATVQATAYYSSGAGMNYTLDNTITNTTGLFPGVVAGQHVIRATVINGACTTDSSFTISAFVNVVDHISTINPDDCKPASGRITIVSGSPNKPVGFTLLNTGEVQPSGNFTNLPAGVYGFRITDAAGCTKDTAIELTATPVITVSSFGITTARCHINNGEIKINTGTDTSGIRTSINNSTFTPALQYNELSSGTYRIQVKKGSSCYTDTTIVIDAAYPLIDCELFIPTAFTPNNDGRNDLFQPSYPLSIKDVVLQVYNRWGDRIYEGKGPLACWDGKHRGALQSSGVYVYILSYADLPGTKKHRSGTVTLIR